MMGHFGTVWEVFGARLGAILRVMSGSEFEGFVRNIGRKPCWSLGACLFPFWVIGPPRQPLPITNTVADGPGSARNHAEPGAVL
jgi:hypothetical protein